jgi:Tfp pilus assembly protein PilX
MSRANMAKCRQQGPRRRQAGMVLITALVMLVVVTLLVIAAINMTNVNTRIAYNMQIKEEAQAATQQVIEQMISNPANFNSPLPPPTTVAVDINNDGTADYSVAAPTPSCIAAAPIKQNQLDATNPADIPCFGTSSLQNTGLVGGKATAGASLCASTTWDVSTSYTDPSGTGLNVVTHQGVNLRVVAGTTC